MRKLLILAGFILYSSFLLAQETVIPLYSGAAPGSESWNWDEAIYGNNQFNARIVYNVSKPTITAYLPAKGTANGTAIIVAPGGAFHILSIDSEGIEVARWLNERGVTAFVLKYRVVKSETADPVKELMPLMANSAKLDFINAPVVEMATQDGLTAVKYVRDHAETYGIDPKRIGFMGFSAGGTLTLSVVQTATDANRPNFVAPIYAYEKAVLGTSVPVVQTPIFVAAASDDNLGFASHSVNIYTKWLNAKQPAELHMYEKGGHGFGIRKMNTTSDRWILDFEAWLKFHGLIAK
jgi:acetyl esterase/lipase